MKRFQNFRVGFAYGSIIALVSFSAMGVARSQVYVSTGGGIAEYSSSSGAAVNQALVGGLNFSYGLAINDDDLYVANVNNGVIGEYNAITGAAINGTFTTNQVGANSLAIYNGNLYVDNSYQNSITEYNLSTGAEVGNSPLLTSASGLSTPSQIAISSTGDLVVANSGANDVLEFNATTGGVINTNNNNGVLIRDSNPYGVAISGNDVYASDFGGGLLEYNLSTDAEISQTVVYPLRYPTTLAVSGNNLYVGGDSGGVDLYNATTLTQVGTTTFISSSANYGIVVGSFVSPPVTQTTTTNTTVTTSGSGANYSNVTPVKTTGGLGTTVSLIAGSNTTGASQVVTLASTTLGTGFSSLASDVFTVSGNDHSLFALQLSFDLNAANTLGGPGNMTLLYNNGSVWENAVLGDHGTNNATGGELDFQGSFLTFEQTYGTNLSAYLGAYGVDTTADVVWAVIDHNSTFGTGSASFLPEVVDTPEPSTWATMLAGGLIFFGVFGRRFVLARNCAA